MRKFQCHKIGFGTKIIDMLVLNDPKFYFFNKTFLMGGNFSEYSQERF